MGCGRGSGHGKTSTRGHKGQKARSGYSLRPGFEGGQNPLYRRLPKRGFNREGLRTPYHYVNLGRINQLEAGEITPEILATEGVLKKKDVLLKVLGGGEITKAVKIHAHRFSGSAKTKIEKAGGQAILIETGSKS